MLDEGFLFGSGLQLPSFFFSASLKDSRLFLLALCFSFIASHSFPNPFTPDSNSNLVPLNPFILDTPSFTLKVILSVLFQKLRYLQLVPP